jgi:signal peptidase I
MTPISDNRSRLAPWLSVWFKPGDTIEQALVRNPNSSPLLLAGFGMTGAGVGAIAAAGLAAVLFDWRVLAATVVVGPVIGVLLLYVNAFFVALLGMTFGGEASLPQVRAALAWSLVPNAVGLALCLAVLAGLTFSGAHSAQWISDAVDVGARAIILPLGLWAVVAAVLMLRRVQGFGVLRAGASLIGGLMVSGVVVALPITRTFVFQPFNTPSGSMMPTLLVGDYFFVSKYPYGYSRYSLPFSPPLFAGRIFPSEPARGDVVVFRLPSDDSVDYIKRIIGLPGDRIQMIDGMIHINGKPVERERVDFVDPEDGSKIRRWREILPNGVGYYALDLMDNGFLDNTQVYNVPAGHYFVLGDNLDNSTDSRILSVVGYVPFENLIGRAEVVYFSIDRGANNAPAIRYEGIGTRIR